MPAQTTSTRPPLPIRHLNPHVQATLNSGSLPPVKYQILSCQGQEILIGRLKIETPTPTGHAFILRRFDTGAISLTTMFRAAFPTASDDAEKKEALWVKQNFDLSGNNGSSKEHHITRLAGTWVSVSVAEIIGKEYRISPLISTIAEAQPDPNGNYRRSGRGTTAPNGSSPNANTTVDSPPPSTVTTTNTIAAPATTVAPPPSVKPPSRSLVSSKPPSPAPPSKRRKESSPSPAPSKPESTAAPRTLRRSTRTKSPAPKPAAPVQSLTTSTKTPKKAGRREEVVTPGGSDETAVDEGEGVKEVVAGSELHQQDIAEQKQMIADLKAQREAALQEIEKGAETSADGEGSKLKRTREEEAELKFNFKEPEVGERAIATNRRVSRFQLEPRQKSFAWGVAAFAVGLGAMTLLPNIF